MRMNTSPERAYCTRARAHTHTITVEKLEHNKSDGRAPEALFGYLNSCVLEWFDIEFSLIS